MRDSHSLTIEEIILAQQLFTKALASSSSSMWMELDFSMPQLKTLVTL